MLAFYQAVVKKNPFLKIFTLNSPPIKWRCCEMEESSYGMLGFVCTFNYWPSLFCYL